MTARVLKGIITWTKMGQQTTRAKEVYYQGAQGEDQETDLVYYA